MLSQESIASILPIGQLGRELVFQETIGSTNDLAKRLAEQGRPAGTLVVADEQTAGRGRGNRGWVTPAGTALALSVVLRPHLTPGAAALTLNGLGALAVVEALLAVGIEAEIKWPNDVLVGGRKAAGVLAEVAWSEDRIDYAVIGIGVNVRAGSAPPDDQVLFPASSLEQAAGRQIDRLDLLAGILEQIDHWLPAAGQPRLIDAWHKRLAYVGQPVMLEQSKGQVEGDLVGLADDGRLRLLLADGREMVAGQDFVHLRPVDSPVD